MPDVPTSAEQGLPNFLATGWNALFAPRGTPAPVLQRLLAAAQGALRDERTRQRLLDLGADLPEPADQTPEALRRLVSSELDKWVPIIRQSGVGQK